jgi:hypothetical protein
LRGGGFGLFTGCAAGDTAMAVVLEVCDAKYGMNISEWIAATPGARPTRPPFAFRDAKCLYAATGTAVEGSPRRWPHRA